MDSGSILTIAIPILVALAVLVLFTTARRRDAGQVLSRETLRQDRSSRFLEEAADGGPTGHEVERAAALVGRAAGTDLERAAPAAPTTFVAPDPEAIGVTRRQFFNRSILAMSGLGFSGFGGAVLAFLWPTLSGGGFGSKITVGSLDDILGEISDTREPFYVSQGRFYLITYPAEFLSEASKVYSPAILPGMEAGVVALYQKCTHLGCRVPWCPTSQWFECPCHGSQFNRVGEKKGGPAPRGLDRFPVSVERGKVSVDSSVVIEGPPVGTNTTGQEAEGPHCVGASH